MINGLAPLQYAIRAFFSGRTTVETCLFSVVKVLPVAGGVHPARVIEWWRRSPIEANKRYVYRVCTTHIGLGWFRRPVVTHVHQESLVVTFKLRNICASYIRIRFERAVAPAMRNACRGE